MAKLLITSPEGSQEAELQAHNSLGRHPGNSIQLLDRVVSKEHCHIDLSGERYVLRDLNSLNGTFVNGERITEWVLSEADEVTLGGTTMVFVAVSSAASYRPNGEAREGLDRRGSHEEQSSRRSAKGWSQDTIDPASRGKAGPFKGTPRETQASRQPSPRGRADAAPARSAYAALAAPPTRTEPSHNLTITSQGVESQIRTKLQPLSELDFLPEKRIRDVDQLRADYEKLRASHEVIRAIGIELDVQKLLSKVLDSAFHLLHADRGVILLYGDDGELEPRCIRTRSTSDSESIVLSTTILNEVLRDKAAVISSDASIDARFQGAHSVIMQGIRSTMAVPLLHSGEVFGVMMLDSQIATNAFAEKDLQLLQSIANQAAIAIQNSLYAKKLEHEAVTRERFERLLSPAIAAQVVSGEVEVAQGGQQREVTVLFCDIRGFTAMSEIHRPQEIVDMLNEYFESMVEVIFRHEGTLDKFIGDEIMAIFGAPVAHDDDPERAVRTALQMRAALNDLNRIRQERQQTPIHVGIGINTGEVVAGYLGSRRALEYTVIGDTVNTASRLCSLAKPGDIIISDTTHRRVAHNFHTESLPAAQVKGKAKALSLFRVLAEDHGHRKESSKASIPSGAPIRA